MSHDRKKILILAANPKGSARLRLDEEVREIQHGLERARQREQFEIISSWAIRPDDLRRALLDHKPQIVHFSGHGTGETGLAVEDRIGQVQLLSTKALADLLRLFEDCIECVVLNACYSEVQAEAINQHINYVIGMSQGIGDRAAIQFATGFYDALGAGRSYEDAYKFGCNAIDLENIPEDLTPQIKVNEKRLSQIGLPPPPVVVPKPPLEPKPKLTPPPPPTSPSPELLYNQAYRLHQADRWQDVIRLMDQIKTLDVNYPDSRGLLLSAQRELKLAALYDRALRLENQGERRTAVQAFQEICQSRKGYRDTEARIAKLRKPSPSKSSTSSLSPPLLKLLPVWAICWIFISGVAYLFLGVRTTDNMILPMTGFGLVGGAVSSLVKQLVIAQASSLNLKRISLWAGLDAGIWMVVGLIARTDTSFISLAPVFAAVLSFVSNLSWQLLQPGLRR